MRSFDDLLMDLRQPDLALPGRLAHQPLSPLPIRDYRPKNKDYREAAVLFLIYPSEQAWHTVFIERASSHPADKHAGQISLPGGKVEVTDRDRAYAACREVEEEIGVCRGEITVVRPLSDLYVLPSNFMVFPYIGVIDYTPAFVLQPSEVASIIPLPLKDLKGMQPQKRDLEVRGQVMRDIPYYDLYGHVLWGATSMITSEFQQLLAAIEV